MVIQVYQNSVGNMDLNSCYDQTNSAHIWGVCKIKGKKLELALVFFIPGLLQTMPRYGDGLFFNLIKCMKHSFQHKNIFTSLLLKKYVRLLSAKFTQIAHLPALHRLQGFYLRHCYLLMRPTGPPKINLQTVYIGLPFFVSTPASFFFHMIFTYSILNESILFVVEIFIS